MNICVPLNGKQAGLVQQLLQKEELVGSIARKRGKSFFSIRTCNYSADAPILRAHGNIGRQVVALIRAQAKVLEIALPREAHILELCALAMQWHGGQKTELYRFGSSGVVSPRHRLALIAEIKACLMGQPSQVEQARLQDLLHYVSNTPN